MPCVSASGRNRQSVQQILEAACWVDRDIRVIQAPRRQCLRQVRLQRERALDVGARCLVQPVLCVLVDGSFGDLISGLGAQCISQRKGRIELQRLIQPSFDIQPSSDIGPGPFHGV